MMSLISEPGGLPSSESGDSLRTRQSLRHPDLRL
jgi:hypothetical protein